MNVEQFNIFCARFKGASYVNQWGGSHVWKVENKVFALGKFDAKPLSGISFKTSELNFHFLENKPLFRGAPYMASRGMKWIQHYRFSEKGEILTDMLQDAKSVEELLDELQYYISDSYKLVVAGLSKKLQAGLLAK